MFDSAATRSEGGTVSLSAWPRAERVPRMHWIAKKDGFKASLMTCTSDTVRIHLQRCRTLGEGLLELCAHQSPYTGRTHRLFPSPQAASVRPRFEPTATPPIAGRHVGDVSATACLFVYDYSRNTGYEVAYKRYQQLQCYKGKKIMWRFC